MTRQEAFHGGAGVRIAGALLGFILFPAAADAEQPVEPVSAESSDAQSEALGDIVVTATRRAERLQDVPISAQVFDSKTLTTQNVTRLDTLTQLSPSVRVSDQRRNFAIAIRGITSGPNVAFDSSVGLFLDDIYNGRSRSAGSTLLDVDHIEVLKGPQTTYFGNNAIAGAFSITSKKPTRDFDASARALYGMFGQYALEAAVGGPLDDTLAIRVAAMADGQNGWIDNIFSDTKGPRLRNYAGRVSLRFVPNDDFDATLKVEGARSRKRGNLYLHLFDCPPPPPFKTAGICAQALASGVPIGLDTRNIAQSESKERFGTYQTALTMNYVLGSGDTVTSTTGYYGYKSTYFQDQDATPFNFLNNSGPERFHQFSQEVRLASELGRPVEYLGGLYFQDSFLISRQRSANGLINGRVPATSPLQPFLPLGQGIDFRQREKSYSAFAALTWNVTDQLKVIGGLRGTIVDKSYSKFLLITGSSGQVFNYVPLSDALQALANPFIPGVLGESKGSRSDKALMPSAKVQYSWSRDIMTYASYNRGFLAGGFNGQDGTGLARNINFGPEYVNAYEVGLKGSFFDRALTLNLAAFTSDYKDLQVAQITPDPITQVPTSVVRNAASVRSRGVELEAAARFNDAFRLNASITYLDAKYRSYPNAASTPLQQVMFGPGYLQDLAGVPPRYSPRWSGTVSPEFTLPLAGSVRLTTRLDAVFSSRFLLLEDTQSVQKGYVRLDGQASLEFGDGRWAIDVIGRNLNNRLIYTLDAYLPTSPGSRYRTAQMPRNVMVQLRYKY